jgi:hypothetical protein
MNEDLAILNVVRFKLATEGTMTPDRKDVRDVGKVRAKYKFAKQRDDETYTDYVARMVTALERNETS